MIIKNVKKNYYTTKRKIVVVATIGLHILIFLNLRSDNLNHVYAYNQSSAEETSLEEAKEKGAVKDEVAAEFSKLFSAARLANNYLHYYEKVKPIVTKNHNQKSSQESTEVMSPITLNPYSSITLSKKDYSALERIVQAEAGGEPEDGKILVAQVILNRVMNKNFADTVYDIIFEKIGGSAQFSPTIDGRYETVTVTKEVKEAVQKALYGKDISNGALFFSARSTADPQNMEWFDSNLRWLFQCGGHEFYTLR
jgi:N-acetylmuramoyl-L-alanine amidase